MRVLDVFERGEDEFDDDEKFDDDGGESRAEVRLEVRRRRRTRSRRRGFGNDALFGVEEQCALFDDFHGGDGNDDDDDAKKKKERKRRVSIQLRARFEGRDASFRCG